MKATFFIDKPKKENTTAVIYVAVTLGGKRTKTSTGIKIDPKKWSNGYPVQKQTLIIGRLNELQALITKHLATREVTPLSIKNVVAIWQGKATAETSSIRELIQKYTTQKKNQIKPITYKKVVSDLKDFDQFKPTKQIADLNKELLTSYLDTLKTKNLEISTLNNYVKNLKAFLKWAYINDYTTDLAKYVNKFKIEQKEIIAINENELQQLERHMTADGKHIELSDRLQRVCDSFLFGCYTGLRFSDLQRVDPSMISDEVLIIRQQKTNNVVAIPLIRESLNILDKHSGTVPTISHQKANDYLKELFRALEINRQVMTTTQKGAITTDTYQPLSDVISIHVARKSFITIALSKGMHAKVVQSISGHKKDEIFNKYIAFSTATIKEQMSKMSASQRYMHIDKEA